jgi:hypothetical protein
MSISRLRWRAALALGAAAAAVVALAVPAGASTGTSWISPEQAGYAATGAQFKTVHTDVYLRNPAQYAGYVAGFRHSIQLWSSDLVVSLDVEATTGPSEPFYVSNATIYNRSTHQVIAHNPNQRFCDPEGTCSSRRGIFEAATEMQLSIVYSPADGRVTMTEHDPTIHATYTSHYTVTRQSFTQARVGTEFGSSPWDASYSHTGFVAMAIKIAAYSNVRLTSYSGHTATLWSWWVHHKLLAFKSATEIVAAPSNLMNGGADFNTKLQ